MIDNQQVAHAGEQQRLAVTLGAIDAEVASLRDLGWSGGAVPHAAFQVQQWGWDKSDRLLNVRSSPYFGRIDLLDDAHQAESFYIGPEGLAHPSGGGRLIVDWRAPISEAFYRPNERTLLKRRIEIADAQLVRFTDEYVRELVPGAATSDAHADPMLLDILSAARGGELGSIVRTIQAKQDQLIRATDAVLVVQGAAGTGKTVVALHRIAYLLYQARTSGAGDGAVQDDLTAQRRRQAERPARRLRIAVFGPNTSYLRHIRDVLPALGEHDVVETTFDDWVRSLRIDERLDGLVRDDDLEELLDASRPRDERERAFRRSRAKGSLEMGATLSRYVSAALGRRVDAFTDRPLTFVADVAGRPLQFSVRLTEVTAQQRLAGGTPLSQIRELVRDRMRQAVLAQLERQLANGGLTPSGQETARQRTHVLDRFNAEFDRRWPRPNVVTLYTHLLGDEGWLREAAAGTGLKWAFIHEPSPVLRTEDFAPLAHLRVLVDGPLPIRPPATPDAFWTSLDHAVIDEAQDLPPLALQVLRRHAESLTVLGDMNQTVYAHRGCRTWSEVMRALGKAANHLQTLSVSYRSTRQIADLANHVVKVGGLEGGVSRPYPRVGSQPILRPARTQADLVDRVVAFVERALAGDGGPQEGGAPTVAIVTRSAARAHELQEALQGRLSVPSIAVVDRRDDRDAPVVIMPSYLAKGIEFDAVAVVDVDAETYAAYPNDAAALYVGITRALHQVMLVWVGAASPLIAAQTKP